MIASPCVAICEMDAHTHLCRGCWRTIGEITEWGQADDPRRRSILDAIAARRAQKRAVR